MGRLWKDEQIRLAQSHPNKPMYSSFSKGANDVDEKICELMSKINWPNLKNLNLGTNHNY